MAKKSAKKEVKEETHGVQNERLDHAHLVDRFDGTPGDDDELESPEWEEETSPVKPEY